MSTTNNPLASGMQSHGESGANGGVKAKLADATSHVRNTAAYSMTYGKQTKTLA